MKKIYLLILFFSVSFLSLGASDSIAHVVIGYIEKSVILESHPQMSSIEKELSQLRKEYEDEFINMTKEYERKVKSYLEKNDQMSDPIKLAKQTEITELEARMSMYKQRYQEELANRKAEKIRPIEQQIDNAIKAVCEELGITIVLDKSQPIYISAQCVDVTELVKLKLKIGK